MRVVSGLSAGQTGSLVGLWPRHFGGIPLWKVDLGGLSGERVIRADYLRVMP